MRQFGDSLLIDVDNVVAVSVDEMCGIAQIALATGGVIQTTLSIGKEVASEVFAAYSAGSPPPSWPVTSNTPTKCAGDR